jgi:hypothetical protein
MSSSGSVQAGQNDDGPRHSDWPMSGASCYINVPMARVFAGSFGEI